MKSILNKWQPHFFLGSNYFRDKIRFDIGLVKIIQRPDLGEAFSKKHYKGFLFKIELPHPNLFKLRLQKFFLSRLYRWLWSHIPFEIASCDITPEGVYEDYPKDGNVLAEFDSHDKHWIIFVLKKQ